MASNATRWFYKTGEWKAVRKTVLLRDGFTCPYCGKRATDVHHIVEITEKNMHDANVTLNPSNLQSLCHSCHTLITNAEHGKAFIDCDMNYYFDTDGQLKKINNGMAPRSSK